MLIISGDHTECGPGLVLERGAFRSRKVARYAGEGQSADDLDPGQTQNHRLAVVVAMMPATMSDGANPRAFEMAVPVWRAD